MYPQNHDMDDLFRKAATHYPLRAGESEWERIEQQLKLKPNERLRAADRYYGGRKYYAWLLLLLPALFLFHNSVRKTAVTDADTIQSRVTINQELTGGDKTRQPGKMMIVRKQAYKPFTTENNERHVKELNDRVIASIPRYIDIKDAAATGQMVPGKIILPSLQKPISNDLKRLQTVDRGFYLGAFAGLDWSTVKGQSLAGPGYNLGIMGGYRFNKRWSFELAMSWVQKNYFTRGGHFSMNKIESSMPGGMKMEAVQGRLMLVEIPYKIKYDLLLKERSNLFFTAGGSTNIYVKESNKYLTRVNGVQELMQATYKDVHCSLLCAAHVSVGYERRLRNQSTLRLEPYIKFPLRKVGMGSLPILNVGLNVSISNFTGR
jgi:hypothetical protein